MAGGISVDRSPGALRKVLIPLALAQFICSFAGSNMNVMIKDISDDLDTTVKHRLRPTRSVHFPQGIMRAAMIRRNKVMHTCTPWTLVCRSSLMSLIMTFMLEPAKLQMNWASASGTMNARADLTQPAVAKPGCEEGAALMPSRKA